MDENVVAFRENQQVLINRMHRMRKLIAVLDSLPGADWDSTFALARRLTDAQWADVASLVPEANFRPPSAITQRMVIEGLAERLKIRHRLATRQGVSI